MRTKDTNWFVEKSKLKHGDKYNYSKVEYKASRDKVCIICPIHGEFWQEPASHIRGNGCPKCSIEKNTKAKLSHGYNSFYSKIKEYPLSKYSYEKTIYTGNKNDIIVTCPLHGDFITTPNALLSGHVCKQCSSEKRRKDVYGFGYIEDGYPIKNKKVYCVWRCMISRCYNKRDKHYNSYKHCTICGEWRNFANFEKWYDSQYKEEGWEIDKDWLIYGNNIYSPQTCCLLPSEINKIIINYRCSKTDLPVGVQKRNKKYTTSISCSSKHRYLGMYDNILEASEIYKREKRKTIIEMANKWKDKIPENVYNSMLNFKVN